MNESIDITPAGENPYEVEIQAQIIAAFKMFDEDGDGMIHSENLGTIVRGLGCCPSEEELNDLLKKVEDGDSGYLSLKNLLGPLSEILLKDKWKSASREKLITAFEVFDEEKLGLLDADCIKDLLSECEEAFNEKELKLFLSSAMHPKIKKIYYKQFCKNLVPEVLDILEHGCKIRTELYSSSLFED